MLPDEIQQSVNTFLHSVKVTPSLSQDQINHISSISDIRKSIHEKYAISLPPTIISFVESNNSNGKLNLQSSYALICATIEQNKCAGYSWQDTFKNPYKFSAYVKDVNRTNADDIVVRQIKDETGAKYSAFKLLANHTSLFLARLSQLLHKLLILPA